MTVARRVRTGLVPGRRTGVSYALMSRRGRHPTGRRSRPCTAAPAARIAAGMGGRPALRRGEMPTLVHGMRTARRPDSGARPTSKKGAAGGSGVNRSRVAGPWPPAAPRTRRPRRRSHPDLHAASVRHPRASGSAPQLVRGDRVHTDREDEVPPADVTASPRPAGQRSDARGERRDRRRAHEAGTGSGRWLGRPRPVDVRCGLRE